MKPDLDDGGARPDDVLPTPSPSSRVRLEVALLVGDQAVPNKSAAVAGETWCRTVIIVAAEPDVRRYVGECLRDRVDLRTIEAGTMAAAIDAAAQGSPSLLIAEASEREVAAMLPRCPVILLVDDVPHGVTPGERVRLVQRPFSADQLVAEVDRVLSTPDAVHGSQRISAEREPPHA